jgi:hypothetical protein
LSYENAAFDLNNSTATIITAAVLLRLSMAFATTVPPDATVNVPPESTWSNVTPAVKAWFALIAALVIPSTATGPDCPLSGFPCRIPSQFFPAVATTIAVRFVTA